VKLQDITIGNFEAYRNLLALPGYKCVPCVKRMVKMKPTHSESVPLPDEIEAIHLGRNEIRRGETVGHDEIDWS